MLLELISSCGLDFDCLKIAILSLAHRAQLLLANIFNALMGLPEMIMQVIPPHCFIEEGCVSWAVVCIP